MNVIATLVFASGFSALVYQVLWTRLVTTLIGGSDYAVAIIVTIFMAGLGMGSRAAGLLSRRIKNAREALVLFAAIEMLTAVYAMVLPRLASQVQPWLSWCYRNSSQHPDLFHFGALMICALLIIPPVLLMGATLPVLCSAVAGNLEASRLRVPILYGFNTLGAASGALVTGFFLVYQLGVTESTWLAAAINMAVAACCLIMVTRNHNDQGHVAGHQNEPPGLPSLDVYQRHIGWVALVVTFVSGFVSLSSEVIWTKLFGLLAGPTTFSFSAVLFSYILCLGTGSLIAVYFTRRYTDVMPALLFIQILVSFSVVAFSHLIGHASLFFAKINYAYQHHPGWLEAAKVFAILGLIGIPVTLIGISFPLAFRAYSIARRGVGESMGNVYAVNTLGSVLGSGLSGFILVPWLGMESSLSLISSFQLGVTVFLALVVFNFRPSIRMLAVAGSILGILFAAKYPAWSEAHLAEGKYHRFKDLGLSLNEYSYGQALWFGTELISQQLGEPKLLYYGEGIGGFTAVLEEMDVLGNRRVYMANSGKVDASSHGDIYTQALLAHLPVMAKPDATNALTIGFGCGMTSGELLHYPGLTVDSVEISPQVVAGARYFDEWNNHVLDSNRNRMIIQDARAHLALGDNSYDIITAEPSNPWMAGLASLFTLEYLNLVKSRLSRDGVFVQFLHTYQMDWRTFSLMARTITKVFPNSVLFRPAFLGSDYALLCFKESEATLDVRNVEAALVHARASQVIRVLRPEVIYPLIVTENLRGILGEGPVHTDNDPLLELWAPRSMFRSGSEINQRLESERVLSVATRKVMDSFAEPEVRLAFAEYLACGNQSPFIVMDASLADDSPAVWSRYIDIIRDYARENPVWDYSTVPESLKNHVADVQEELILRQRVRLLVEEDPDSRKLSASHSALASLYSSMSRPAELAQALIHLVLLNPDDWSLKASLASLYFQQGAYASALEMLKVHKDLPVELALMRTQCLLLLGEKNAADRYVRNYMGARPDSQLQSFYDEAVTRLKRGHEPSAE